MVCLCFGVSWCLVCVCAFEWFLVLFVRFATLCSDMVVCFVWDATHIRAVQPSVSTPCPAHAINMLKPSRSSAHARAWVLANGQNFACVRTCSRLYSQMFRLAGDFNSSWHAAWHAGPWHLYALYKARVNPVLEVKLHGKLRALSPTSLWSEYAIPKMRLRSFSEFEFQGKMPNS